MRLGSGREVGARQLTQLVGEQFLRVHRVVLVDGEELGDPGEVVDVIQGISVVGGPAFGDLSPERQGVRRGPGAQERRADPIGDAGQQQFPIGISQWGLRRRA